MAVPVTVERRDLLSPEAQELIAALNAELRAMYPEEGANHFRLDPGEVAPGNGAFLVARAGDTLVGCGATRRLDAVTFELKRMFVRPVARGRGVGATVLAALLAEARTLGATRVVLETGVRQAEAIALYRRAGFDDIPAFGEYIDSPLSVCLAKLL